MERYWQGIPSSTGWWRGRRKTQQRSLRRKGRDSEPGESVWRGAGRGALMGQMAPSMGSMGTGDQPTGQLTGQPSGRGNIKVRGRRALRPGPADGQAVCLMKPACAFADTHGEGISPGWARGACPVALGSWPQPLPARHEGQLACSPAGAPRDAGGWQGGLGPPELQLDPGGCVRAPAMVAGRASRREPGGPWGRFL